MRPLLAALVILSITQGGLGQSAERTIAPGPRRSIRAWGTIGSASSVDVFHSSGGFGRFTRLPVAESRTLVLLLYVTSSSPVIGKMAAHIIMPSIHRVFSNMKRWAMGVFHGFRKKYLNAYLNEFVFRWNRRRHTAAAFDSLLGLGSRLAPATYRDFVDQRV